MKVTDVSALALTDEVPPAEQHRTDLGTKVRTHSTLVFVETSEGLTGIGTALGDPSVTTTLVERLGDVAIGEDPMDSGRIWEKMYNGSRWEPAIKRGHPQPRSDRRGTTLEAMAGIDIALWDLKGKICDQPLYKLLGGVRDSIRGYASGGWAPGRRTADELGGYVEEGFDAVKMRVEGEDGFSLDTATKRVEAAREGIGDDVALMIDAHGSLETSAAIRLASRLEPYDIDWFEEPVTPDDHDALAEVRSSTKIPIAAGEREFTRFDASSNGTRSTSSNRMSRAPAASPRLDGSRRSRRPTASGWSHTRGGTGYCSPRRYTSRWRHRTVISWKSARPTSPSSTTCSRNRWR
jgi:L-alanine-DL-glutamate epimerase-like enolase superfamily enzyme